MGILDCHSALKRLNNIVLLNYSSQGLLAGLSPAALLGSASRQPSTAVEQPAAVAGATPAALAAAERLWHGWSPFEVAALISHLLWSVLTL